MTVSLDQMINVGPSRIAVLSDRAVKVIHSNGIVFFTGRKHPVAVLIRQGAALNAFGLEGNPMTREHVENLCPGAWRTVLDAG
ncbi:hypothetical protein [Pseudosulfitobacter sp. SM2401]|uniref:hypothetical protein n=1 Tax=Pseudosulfitobacter sp. SM2401 TaxID=3350098 RepID=UPI0036F22129